MDQEDILDKFQKYTMQKCGSLDTLVYNFKQFIINDVENNRYIENGTLYYVDYKIPTAYIAKYGNIECTSILETYVKSKDINRIPYKSYDNKDECVRLYNSDWKIVKNHLWIKENMYGKYIYGTDDEGNIDEDKKNLTNSNSAVGIIYPIVITK
jgi:hypothetical protein